MARIRVLAENPPPPRGYVEDQLRELRDYITRLKDELEFLLTHLGTDNLEQSLTNKIINAADSVEQVDEAEKALEGRVDQVETALDGKQDTLTFDTTPTASSTNPVTSGGVFTALGGKQNTLTFDEVPTEGSGNPVKSGGVFSALPVSTDTIQGTAANPVTKNYTLAAGGRYLVMLQRLSTDAGLYAVACRLDGTTELVVLRAPAGTTYFSVSVSSRTFSVTAKEIGVAVNILRFGVVT